MPIHWVAAGNTVGSGADDNYTGRMVLDQASLDRFVIIEFINELGTVRLKMIHSEELDSVMEYNNNYKHNLILYSINILF